MGPRLGAKDRTRLTLNQAGFQPKWTPDGQRVAFVLDGNISWVPPTEVMSHVHWYLAGTSNTRVVVTRRARVRLPRAHPLTGIDIWSVSPEDGSGPTPLLVSEFDEATPAFSPDGRWIAYVSDESGRLEVYVRSYPGGETKHTISTAGGCEPLWSRDGNAIYYRNGRQMLAAVVDGTDEIRIHEPEVLFESETWIQPGFLVRNYEVAPDGHFLMVRQERQTRGSTRVNVVLDWTGELDRLVPAN